MKKKTPRLSGIKSRVVYRNSLGHFAKREDSASEETWTYREAIVKGKRKIIDLKREALPFREENVSWFRSIQVPNTGRHAGKLSVALQSTIDAIPVSRHDTLIEVSMTAKTSKGKIVKRKLSFYHYNSHELNRHTVGGIIRQLFYDHGERPAYPVKIVKWDTKVKRHVSRSATEKRRQLHDVTFNIKTTVETRKQGAKRIKNQRRKKK
jgi:hypothetical protein